MLSYINGKPNSASSQLTPLTRDLILMRYLWLLITLGNLLFAWAFKPWLFVLGLILYSAGQVSALVCRAMLNVIVDAQLIATLNTAIAAMEQLATIVSAPLFSELLRGGYALGGDWIGLPYLFTTTAAILMTVVMLLLKPSQSTLSSVPSPIN
jgi:hypothetical protein